MAKINVDTNISEGVGGADFVQQGSAVANTLAPDALAAIAEGAKDVFVIGKKEEAKQASKSLLEELTGNDRLLDIAKQEQDAFAVENDLANEIAADPSSAQGPQGQQLEQVQGLKQKLAREREAVVQGLLTNDEFRIRAEQSFYQMVAMTPGIKSELAKVMGEHLGIDPRGQTAAVTMAARDDITAKTDTATKKIVGELVSSGFYDSNISEKANIMKYWPHVQKDMQAQHELKVLTDTLNGQGIIDGAERDAAAKTARSWVAQAEQRSLYSLGAFKGQNIFDLSSNEIVNMDEETRVAWAQSIQAQGVQFSSVLNGLETSTGASFAANRDTVQQQQELLLSIINSTQLNDQLTQNLAIGKARNDILVEAAKADIAMTQPQAVKLAAYSKFMNISNMIGVNITGSTMVLQGLNGDIPNLENLGAEDKEATLDMYVDSAKSTSQTYDLDPKSITDNDIGNMGNVGTMISDQDPVALGSIKPSLQLFRLASRPDFMTRLESVDPVKAQRLSQGVIKHQKAVGQNYNKEISSIIESTTGAHKLDSLDFHLEKVEDTWLVVPNTGADVKPAPVGGGDSSAAASAALSKRATAVMEQTKNELTVKLNRTRGMINNMVISRAAATGLPVAQAAKQVAQDLGISTIDGEEVKPGFAEEAGVSAPKNRPKPQDIDMNELSVEELNALSDASAAAVKARNAQ